MEEAYYISKQDIETLIDYFKNNKPVEVGSKVLKGIVFRLGENTDGKALFPDLLYSASPTGFPDPRNDLQIMNNIIATGCPYPPGYPEPIAAALAAMAKK